MCFATGCTQPTTGGILEADPITLLRCHARLSRLHSSAPAEPAPFPPSLPSPRNCRVNPTWEFIQQNNKSSFLCWAYSSAGSGVWAIPAHAAQRLISLAWEKNNKHSAGESDSSYICWWKWLLTPPEVPMNIILATEKNKLQSRKFIWAKIRYKMFVQYKFPNNSTGFGGGWERIM